MQSVDPGLIYYKSWILKLENAQNDDTVSLSMDTTMTHAYIFFIAFNGKIKH